MKPVKRKVDDRGWTETFYVEMKNPFSEQYYFGIQICPRTFNDIYIGHFDEDFSSSCYGVMSHKCRDYEQNSYMQSGEWLNGEALSGQVITRADGRKTYADKRRTYGSW